ncbi:MAG: hypothetical protein NT049_05935, partial [Planctomycetota bacterium]|nr:hypothetical protein [Planctomycetota bacterium]
MRFRTLVARGLRFHWRSHLAVGAGALVATAVLVGALVVGDSVRYSLREMALERLGVIESALVASESTFRAALAGDLEKATPDTAFAAVLQVRGVAAREDGTARINQVQVLGMDGSFLELSGARSGPRPALGADGVAVNERTARQLGVSVGDSILLRFEKPSAVPLDAPLSGEEDRSLAVHMTVKAIAGRADFGRFSLQANQVPPFNVFVDRTWLEQQLDLKGRANIMLAGAGEHADRIDLGLPNKLLEARWTLADAELQVRAIPDRRGAELLSKRIFLDPALAPAAAKEPGATGILTYFVNELRVGERATPYSMVTAVGPLAAGEERGTLSLAAILPAGMADDEIVINTWLAEDLGAKPGDALEMSYYVIGPTKRLETASSRFRIRAVVPLEGAAADRTLMPDFPGLADVENCRDWKPGAPVDLKKIRKKDEAYWNQYRGTPKALVTLAAGRKMWANRFGDLTAIRFP